MSEGIVIQLDRVSKEFRGGSAASMGFKAAMVDAAGFWKNSRRYKVRRVLEEVSLEVRNGECLGVIGQNGSGKSTLLGLMAGVLRPNSGSVWTSGRICPLLQLGAGFHHELSGLDNIMLNGVLLGMTRREVAARRDRIIEFSGLAETINEPIRTYSSGMVARLGFSVAIHMEPEILLLDEVLAVGDEAFQSKCLRRISELQAAGAASVFVSHDLPVVARICNRVALIHGCRVHALGVPTDVLPIYRQILG